MRLLILVTLVTTATSSFARDIVWNFQETTQLRKQFIQNPLFQKRRILRDRRIQRSSLGRANSPFYQIGQSIYRDFKTFSGGCFQVQIKEKSSYARKANCYQGDYQLVHNDVIYTQVKNLAGMNDYSFKIQNLVTENSFLASHFTAEMHRREGVLMEPHSRISIKLEETQEFKIEKQRLSLLGSVIAKRTPYAFLDSRIEKMEQNLKLEPMRGDYIFKNGHQFVLFKRYQPAPLNFRLLESHHLYPDYLANIENHLFPFSNDKRCMRDNILNRSDHDCDFLIFKKQAYGGYYPFSAILVDTEEKTVKRL